MTFMADAYRLAEATPRVRPREGTQILRGRALACEFIDALRWGGCIDEDIMASALVVAEQCGPLVFCGFLREIEDALREGGEHGSS